MLSYPPDDLLHAVFEQLSNLLKTDSGSGSSSTSIFDILELELELFTTLFNSLLLAV